jgi:hypothetical protein
MKADTQQEPGSTRSCHTPLSRSATMASRVPGVAKNPYRIRTESDHFGEVQIFNYSASTTYNFNALKCTDFLEPSYRQHKGGTSFVDRSHGFALTFSPSHFLTCNRRSIPRPLRPALRPHARTLYLDCTVKTE